MYLRNQIHNYSVHVQVRAGKEGSNLHLFVTHSKLNSPFETSLYAQLNIRAYVLVQPKQAANNMGVLQERVCCWLLLFYFSVQQ